MDLEFFNSRTRVQEVFYPIDSANVRMYVCGPTVYDRAHIGNARPAVVFDVLFRLLRHCYGASQVTYVRNITDLDDKINARAALVREGGDQRPLLEIVKGITEQTVQWYHEDMDLLGILRPTHEPRATHFVPPMISMIKTLISSGHAYESQDHVLFSVESYSDYGSLAKRSLEDMIAGARVEQAPYKRNAMDFVLWKPSSDELPGWDSPWGRGRPGWHIECSAMSLSLLGKSFDIHGGGIDLAFPHHENEAAQSLCANPNSDFAKLWMHNGYLQVEGEKMAKSRGNFITVKNLRDKGLSGEVIRLALLSTHYRQPLDWTERKLAEMRQIIRRWSEVAEKSTCIGEPRDSVVAALADDLNTVQAIAELHVIAREGDTAGLRASAELLGLSLNEEPQILPTEVNNIVERLLRQRSRARRNRDFKTADAIRDQLETAGISIRDSTKGTDWSANDEFNLKILMSLHSISGEGK